MNLRPWLAPLAMLSGLCFLTPTLPAQPPQGPGGGPPFGPGGFGGPPMMQQRKLLAQFDKDNNGWLNKAERQAARAFLKKERDSGGPGGRRFGPPPGFGRGSQEPPRPGPHVTPADVENHPGKTLYEPTILRTFFLEFENADWEAELQDFHGTDIEVPATLTVDGKKYPNVGVHFRGMSSYMMVSAGFKRSLNVTLDLVDKKQRLYGYKTLNLLNGHEDPTFLSTVLYSHVARAYIPAPKANLAKVVINGESWGIYTNAQQFNKEFLAENYKTSKGSRWKVRGSPGGGGGLEYVGDNVEDYKRRFEIKSGDDAKAWKALIALCKTLNQTPPDKLEAALAPIMDIDGLLWFLALDLAVINCDGYWIRGSDYSLYRDEKGKFHVIPSDMNECFRPAQGPGFGGPGGMMMRMPRPGELLPSFLQDMLRLTDEQKKAVAALQKEIDGKVEKILTSEQRTQLKGMREGGPFGMGGPPGLRAGAPPAPGGPGGPPGPGGPGMGGRANVELDPLIGLDDSRKPLRSKVLAVPALRTRYLQHLKTIAENSFDWEKLGPVVAQYRKLVEKEVEADTRKLESYEAFLRTTADSAGTAAGRGHEYPLRAFADQRRAYLLKHPEIQKAASGPSDASRSK